MKIPKTLPQKNLTIVHADVDVGDEAEEEAVVAVAMVLAKTPSAANDLLRQRVDQHVTMMISKMKIWIPMRN